MDESWSLAGLLARARRRRHRDGCGPCARSP